MAYYHFQVSRDWPYIFQSWVFFLAPVFFLFLALPGIALTPPPLLLLTPLSCIKPCPPSFFTFMQPQLYHFFTHLLAKKQVSPQYSNKDLDIATYVSNAFPRMAFKIWLFVVEGWSCLRKCCHECWLKRFIMSWVLCYRAEDGQTEIGTSSTGSQNGLWKETLEESKAVCRGSERSARNPWKGLNLRRGSIQYDTGKEWTQVPRLNGDYCG